MALNAKNLLIGREHFKHVYHGAINDVLRYWNSEMQAQIALHNVGWCEGRTDFGAYLYYSELRYWIAFDMMQRSGVFTSWCDVGGLLGAYPLALRRLGIDVAMTECIGFYGNSYSGLFDYLQREGIEIININPFEPGQTLDRTFDVVSVMAVLEHFPHSPKGFLEFVRTLTPNPGSRVYLEVPNITYWPRRWALLKGETPLVKIGDIYKSAVPFIGHHHEYSWEELNQLAGLAGFEVINSARYNYSFVGPWIKRFISDPLLTLASINPSMRECLSVMLKKSDSVNDHNV